MAVSSSRTVEEGATFHAILGARYLSNAEQSTDRSDAKWIGVKDNVVDKASVFPEFVQK